VQTLRNWEYYGMEDIFTDLYEQAKSGGTFNRLYDLIISKENILLAYRNIKSNKGSKTPGTDFAQSTDLSGAIQGFGQKRRNNCISRFIPFLTTIILKSGMRIFGIRSLISASRIGLMN
jgi:hypothetical protein